jgi:hypothetical protein
MREFLDIDPDLDPVIVSAAPRLPPTALRFVADRTDDQDALAAVAASAAAQGDPGLALDALARITYSSSLTHALNLIAPHVPARELLPALDALRDYDRATVLAALVPRQPRLDRDRLLEAAVRAAHAHRGASAHSRHRILTGMQRYLGALPRERLADLWTWAMRTTGSFGRDEVLVDVASFAEPLTRVFGDEVAIALDDAIVVGGVDSWPGPFRPIDGAGRRRITRRCR